MQTFHTSAIQYQKLFSRTMIDVVWRQAAEVVSAQEATFISAVRQVSWGRSEGAAPSTGVVLGDRVRCLPRLHGRETWLNHYRWEKQGNSTTRYIGEHSIVWMLRKWLAKNDVLIPQLHQGKLPFCNTFLLENALLDHASPPFRLIQLLDLLTIVISTHCIGHTVWYLEDHFLLCNIITQIRLCRKELSKNTP